MAPIPIILLNGPPKCGKDTIADALVIHQGDLTGVNPVAHLKFISPLKDALSRLMGETRIQLEQFKDTAFFCKGDESEMTSRRELLIDLSENFVKPVFGKGHWGKLLGQYIEDQIFDTESTMTPSAIIVSDLGFVDEYLTLEDYILRNFPPNTFILYTIKIHRGETNFNADSRGWVSPPRGLTRVIQNDGTVDEAVAELINLCRL